MTRLLKIISYTVFVILACVILALTIIINTIDPNQYKNEINQTLSDLFGAPAAINGKISMHWLPMPSLEVNKMQVGKTRGSLESLSLDSLQLKLKILPLLQAKVEFNSIVLDKAHIVVNLNRPASTSSKKPIKHSTDNTGYQKLAINKLQIKNSQVKIIVNATQQLVLRALNLSLKPLDFSRKNHFNLQSKIKWLENEQTDIQGPVQFKGKFWFDFTSSTEWARAFNLNADLYSKNLKIKQGLVDSLQAKLRYNNGDVSIEPLRLRMYDGIVNAKLSYDIDSKAIKIKEEAKNLNGEKILHDFFDSKLLGGTIALGMNVTTYASSINQLLSNLNGYMNLKIKNGYLKYIDLNHIEKQINDYIHPLNTLNVKALIEKMSSQTPKNDVLNSQKSTPFQLLTGKLLFKNGKAYSDNLSLNANRMQLNGKGSMVLSTQQLDFKIKLHVNSTQAKINQIQKALGGSFPILLQGNLQKPVFLLESSVILALMKNILLQDQVDKVNKGIDYLEQGFKQLFNN